MDSRDSQEFFLSRVTAGTIRVVLIGGWIAWCLQIVLPFLVPVLWGAIIATAVYPLTHRISGRRPKLGAMVFGVVALSVIVVPTYLFFDSIGSFVVRVGRQLAQGELKVPPPRPDVANWPVIGKRIYTFWMGVVNAPASVVEAHRLSSERWGAGSRNRSAASRWAFCNPCLLWQWRSRSC